MTLAELKRQAAILRERVAYLEYTLNTYGDFYLATALRNIEHTVAVLKSAEPEIKFSPTRWVQNRKTQESER